MSTSTKVWLSGVFAEGYPLVGTSDTGPGVREDVVTVSYVQGLLVGGAPTNGEIVATVEAMCKE